MGPRAARLAARRARDTGWQAMAIGVAGFLLARGAAGAAASPRSAALPKRPLATPWPSHVGCTSFAGVEVSVDDRVESVEWRGPEGRSIAVPVAPAPGPDKAEEWFRKGSGGLDYRGVWQASQILFPDVLRPFILIRAARGTAPLFPYFRAGMLDAVVVHPRADPPPRPPSADPSARFGLRLVLRCADPSQPGLLWICDERGCGLRTFRDNPGAKSARGGPRWIDGPYRQRWRNGARSDERARLVCGRADGYDEAARRARRNDWELVCERPAALVDQRDALIEMTRDLLAELDLVLTEGCAGGCANRVDELRAEIRALGPPAPLRLLGARARFVPRYDVLDWPATLGWVARVAGPGPRQIELACANQYVEASAAPPVPSCRLTVIAGGVRLADYFPDNRQEVELPGGGAVHPQGSIVAVEDGYGDTFGDHVVLLGSALAMATDPVPLAKLGNLNVELDIHPGGSLSVLMSTTDWDRGTMATPGPATCVVPASKARATFNGVPLERLTGLYVGGDLQMNRDCFLDLEFPGPTVHETTGGAYGGRVPIPAGMKLGGPIPVTARKPGPASIRIDEGHTHVAFEIADPFAARGLVLVSPADGVLRAGMQVTTRWQPATDDISKGEIALLRPGSKVEDRVVVRNDKLSIQGDRIDFTVPPLPPTLHGEIAVQLIGTANVKPRTGPCPVDHCSVGLLFDATPAAARVP